MKFIEKALLIVSMGWVTSVFSTTALAVSHIKVVDQNGEPLSQAVIEVPLKSDRMLDTPLQIAEMDQINKQFSPTVLVIQQGQSVRFPNSDDIRHHVYSFSEVKPFEIKLYSGKRKEPIMFEKQGIAVLGCNIHDSMVGYIYIAQSPVVAITDEQGKATLTQSLDDNALIHVWHSRYELGPEKRMTTSKPSLQQQEQQWIIQMNVNEPQKRNTFGDMFSQ